MFNLTFWFELGGNSKSIKETVESKDEENRSITFKVLDGELLNDYKSYKFTTQAIPKGEGCLVKWTAEYEKASEDGSDPVATWSLQLISPKISKVTFSMHNAKTICTVC
ncbi:Kirola [Vitis vinifera]|uniref:Kirola n=1 Tax=Vitis vinifera TaxID=29760 RepID=A0A438JUP3_VITVI|nr:Kirola [Vitis vinifera]